MMNRRAFNAIAAGLLVPGWALNAQPPAKVRRIGVLTSGSAAALPPTLFTGLRDLGWIEGRNLFIERRTADGQIHRISALAADLARIPVEVIVTFGAVAGMAAKDATTTIPIVATSGDPVVFGLVSNMSRPGGNVTGIALVAPQLASKRLELLREIFPSAVRIGEPVEPNNKYWHAMRADHERTYRTLAMEPIFVFVTNRAELEEKCKELLARRVDALNIRGDPLFISNRDWIARFAAEHRVPTMSEERPFAEAGALISYGPVIPLLIQRMAVFVDKILKGARPGDIPVEQPTKFELVLNATTAKTLGIAIPQSVRGRVDDVIS